MNNTDNMKSFLFYDYFKVSVDDYYKFELEKKIKICANRAYLDFCRTIAYDHIEKETEQKYSEKIGKY